MLGPDGVLVTSEGDGVCALSGVQLSWEEGALALSCEAGGACVWSGCVLLSNGVLSCEAVALAWLGGPVDAWSGGVGGARVVLGGVGGACALVGGVGGLLGDGTSVEGA